jgi:hypothetical protein
MVRYDFEIHDWLVDSGATVDRNIMLLVTSPKVADWLMQRFTFDREVVAGLSDVHTGSMLERALRDDNYGLASWCLDNLPIEIDEEIADCVETNLVSALQADNFEFVEKAIEYFDFRFRKGKSAIDDLMRIAVDSQFDDACDYLVNKFQLDPRDYGLDKEFGTLGPKFAGKCA